MLAIYITAGYPSIERSLQALKILDAEAVDIIELGLAFSDPLADGPVIQRASHGALEQGANLDLVFELVDQARSEGFAKPNKGLDNIMLFSYYNPLFVYGFDKLISKCQKHHIKGLLIPDLPVNEAQELYPKLKKAGLGLVLLASITSSETRLEQISALSHPFVYLVSRIGTTGSTQDLENLKNNEVQDSDDEIRISRTIQKLRKHNQQIGLGFGIDSPAKVRSAYEAGADIAIIGSKAITELEADSSAELNHWAAFIRKLKAATKLKAS